LRHRNVKTTLDYYANVDDAVEAAVRAEWNAQWNSGTTAGREREEAAGAKSDPAASSGNA
jgi:hypothetical protein